MSLLIRRDATLRISGALHLDIFEQPGKCNFFTNLLNPKFQAQMTETFSFGILNFSDWGLFVIWPACAKPPPYRAKAGAWDLVLNSRTNTLQQTKF
jgi:hypothetical protein